VISTTEPPSGIRECVEELMRKAEALGVDWSQDLLTRGPGPHSYLDVAFAIRMAAGRRFGAPTEVLGSLFSRFSKETGLFENVLPLCRYCRNTPFSHIEYQCAFEPTVYTPMTSEEQTELARDSWKDAHLAFVSGGKKTGVP